jgi:hypothetical protein
MERIGGAGKLNLLCCGQAMLEPDSYQQNSFSGSIVTDTVLSEIKRQSGNGCLLCSLDEWHEEDWD